MYPSNYPYGNMMQYVAGQRSDGEIERREFVPSASAGGWPVTADEAMRKRVEDFVGKNIHSAHKFEGIDGEMRVIYLDERGRSVDSKLSDVPDADLLRMARRYGMRGLNGASDEPSTSATNHGYSKPATESIEEGRTEDEEKYVAGLEKKLRPEIEKHIGNAGKIVDLEGYAPAKGGGWAVVLSTEYAALKLYYVYRNGNTHLTKTQDGWVVSVKPK